METITKQQIKQIYALAAGIGLVERGDKDDPLHQLVYGICGKVSVSELDNAEFKAVQHELIERMKLSAVTAPPVAAKPKKPQSETEAGMMTRAQQNLAWRYIYRLRELDIVPSSASAGERMVGAIGKILGVTAGVSNPFRWVNFEQGTRLIETLKKYVRSAERKAKKAGGEVNVGTG